MLSKNSMYCWPGVSFISSKDSTNFGFLHGGGGKLGGRRRNLTAGAAIVHLMVHSTNC
jgi:hypothetical protein